MDTGLLNLSDCFFLSRNFATLFVLLYLLNVKMGILIIIFPSRIRLCTLVTVRSKRFIQNETTILLSYICSGCSSPSCFIIDHFFCIKYEINKHQNSHCLGNFPNCKQLSKRIIETEKTLNV